MDDTTKILLSAAQRVLPSGYKIVPAIPTADWIAALDDRHMVNDQSSPGGSKLAQMIERVLATAPVE